MRMYTIKVLHPHSRESLLYEYSSIVHPLEGEIIQWKDVQYLVENVMHIMKTEEDSRGKYTSLDYVLIVVRYL